jgi:Cysteine-rich KTR
MNCPKCNNEMRKQYVALDSDTDPEDYFLFCPNCREILIKDD